MQTTPTVKPEPVMVADLIKPNRGDRSLWGRALFSRFSQVNQRANAGPLVETVDFRIAQLFFVLCPAGSRPVLTQYVPSQFAAGSEGCVAEQ